MNARPEVTTFIALGPSTRRRIEHAIEQLIALLDQFDGDFDLEPANDDEDGGDAEPDSDDEE